MKRYVLGAMLIAGLLVLAVPMFGGDKVTFEERVRAQEAIERVYYSHRIWPKENPGPKPPFEKMVTKEQIEAKVADYLKKSAALDQYWHRPVTGEQLQAEMDRMAKSTLQPEVLREIFDALNNDQHLIAECLARPFISESSIRTACASEERFNGNFEDWWKEVSQELDMIISEPSFSYMPPSLEGASCQHGANGAWYPTGTGTPSPEARQDHVAVWTGAEMIIWGGTGSGYDLFTGARFYPATNTWLLTSETDNPSPRHDHAAVWTGTEMIVWGGRNGGTRYNSGGRYNPVSNTWTDTSTTDAPSGRFNHSLVWTGTEMIVWAGYDTNYCNTGGRYNPGDNTWTATSTTDAPSIRSIHTAVWTGTEMIVWGGTYGTLLYVNTGGRYNPTDNSWTATSTTNAPSARYTHTAVWTDTEMIIWGGNYDPGARYNPADDSWTATSTTGAPSARGAHTAVWTGSEMIVWGGYGGGYLNTGGRYNPISNTWIATSTTGPTIRDQHTAVWMGSGTEMIVWGGYYYDGSSHSLNTGGRYCASCSAPIFGGLDSVADPDGCSVGDGIVINWSAPSAWGTGSTTGTYKVIRYTSAGCGTTGTTVVSGLPATTLTYTDTTAVPGTTYYYQVAAVNDCLVQSTGAASCSAAVSDIGASLPSGVPAVTAADADACADTGVEISWPLDPASWGDSGTGTRSYDVLRDNTAIATGIAYGTTTYTDTTGTNGIIYPYMVRFNNGCSLSEITNDVGSWTATTSFTTGRYGHTSVEYNGYLYVIGGYNLSTKNDVQFAPINANGTVGAWTATTNLPAGRQGHASVAYNGYLYVIGGNSTVSPFTFVETLYAPIHSDGTIGAWTATTSIPAARNSHTSATYNGYLYVMGGFDGGIANNDVLYAPINADGTIGAWTATISFPTARHDHASVAYNGYLYVIGGYDDGGASNLNDVQYAPINGDGTIDAWTATTNIPTACNGHTSVAYNRYLYVIGGLDYTPLSNHVHFAPINTDGTIGSWEATTSFTTARYQHTSVTYNGYLYVIGGDASGWMNDVQFSLINAKGADAADNGYEPAGLPAITATDTDSCADAGVLVSWTADPADWGDNGIGTRTYDVLRDGTPLASGVVYGTTTHTDTTGTNGTTYLYTVRYNNGCSFSDVTAEVSAADIAATSPSGISAITATDLNGCAGTGVLITWTADPANWGDGGTGTRTYDVLRNGAAIAAGLAYGTTTHTDTTGTVGTAYLYTIQYNNGCSLSANATGSYCADLTGSTPSGLPTITAADLNECMYTGILVTWPADPTTWGDGGNGTKTYDVLRNGTPISSGIAYGTTSFTDETGVNGTTYTYTVRYNNGCALSAVTVGVQAADLDNFSETAPSGLSAITAADINSCTDTGVLISWTQDPSSWGDNNCGTRSYDVLRNGTTIISGIAYGTTTYTDTTGTNGVSYLYTVRYNNGCSLSAVTNAVGSWTTTTSFTGIRYGHASAAYNGYLYVIGGRTPNLNDVQYAPMNADGSTGAWTATTSFATPRYNHASVAYNGYLYVIGGYSGINHNDVQYAPINSDGSVGNWTTNANSFTTGRNAHTSVAHNGYLYVIGGQENVGTNYYNDVQYAPINPDGSVGTFMTTTSFTTARRNHTSVVYNGYLYVIGGYSGITLNNVQFAPINGDGTIGNWTTTASFNIARWGHTSIADNDFLYVLGGYSGCYNTVQSAPINADGTVGSWKTAVTTFNKGRYSHTSVGYNGYMYVIGGRDCTPLNLNDVQYALINASGARAADTVGAPSQPEITSIVDNDPNLMSGITINYTSGSPSTQHDLYRDGALAQAAFASGSTHSPGDTAPHDYTVKAVNGACSTESAAVQGTDAELIEVPPEIAVGTSYPGDAISWSGTVTVVWPSTGTATGYRLYRGDRSNLANLLGDGTDFCTHYDGAGLNHDCSADDASLVTGRCYFYLVTAYNAGGEGSAGNATQGERRVDSSGGCL